MLEFEQEYLGRGGIRAIPIQPLNQHSLVRNPPVRFGDMPLSLRQVLQNDFTIHDGSVALRVPKLRNPVQTCSWQLGPVGPKPPGRRYLTTNGGSG